MTALADSTFDLSTMIPDLLARHPQARAVLDRYGLQGCGGALGPVESLGFFARTHGVDAQRLLRELAEAAASPEAQQVAVASVEDTIYRRYFVAGILSVLTAGATWGAYLLWKIAFAEKFTGVSIHEVNAHGHAQIFGWVGLFIMGFAYQAFPRLWHTRLAWPRLAVAAFVAMLAGLVIRTVGMAAAGHGECALHLALIGGALEMLSVLIFIAQLAVTLRRSGAAMEPYIGFALVALFFFLAQTGLCVWHTYRTMTATSREALLWQVATWQAPLRDLQIHGLAMLMIFAVNLRMLPALFELPRISSRRSWWALAVLTAAVLLEVGIFVVYRYTGRHWVAAFLMVPWIMLAVGCWMVAGPWKLWRGIRSAEPSGDRMVKFIVAAYAWLAISLVMLLMLPAHQKLTGIAFSHAYYGAIRHAITVGFISLMIMGFAAKVVPTLNGLDVRSLTRLTGPFVLINTGCFLRVLLQALTDAHPAFFKFVGISGTLEVTALAWWGLGLVAIMRRGKRESAIAGASGSSSPRPAQIQPDHVVADIVNWWPQTIEVLASFGFEALRNRFLRATLARTVTIRQAASLKSVDLEKLLRALNEAIQPASCSSSAEKLVRLSVRGRAAEPSVN